MNLKDALPDETLTVQAIYAHWKARGDAEEPRGYLGGSEIGEPCSRRLWYSFRDCIDPAFSGRLYRLFNRGHREEAVFVEELRAIGCEVIEANDDGTQIEVEQFAGHFKGHLDGVAKGLPDAPETWHLLEFKTHSAKSFKDLQKKGVKESKPQHYGQMQVYMQLAKLDRALYLAVNKDTDELYSERIERDATEAKRLLSKAERIIFTSKAPEKIAEKATDFPCVMCPAKNLCHNAGDVAVPVPKLSCRQCCHATPEPKGGWTCGRGHEFGKPCAEHLFLPSLVGFAKPYDSKEDEQGRAVIEYLSSDWTAWEAGSNEELGQYTSATLMQIPKSLVLPKSNISLFEKWETSQDWVESEDIQLSDLQAYFSSKFPKIDLAKPVKVEDKDGMQIADFTVAAVIAKDHSESVTVLINTNES